MLKIYLNRLFCTVLSTGIFLTAHTALAQTQTSNPNDAAETSKIALELLDVSGAKSAYDNALNDMGGYMRANMSTMFEQINVGNGVDKEKMIKMFSERLTTLYKAEMGWDKMQNEYVRLYQSIYTPEEMQGLVAFYKTDLGQKMREKMPKLTQATMAMMQEKSSVMIPKAKQIGMDVMREMLVPPDLPQARETSAAETAAQAARDAIAAVEAAQAANDAIPAIEAAARPAKILPPKSKKLKP